MTKADLIESVATKIDLPKGTAERIGQHDLRRHRRGAQEGDKVNISGFGTFPVSDRKARTGRNPEDRRGDRRSRRRARPSSSPARRSKDSLN